MIDKLKVVGWSAAALVFSLSAAGQPEPAAWTREGVVVHIQLTRAEQMLELERTVDVWSHHPDPKTGRIDAFVTWAQLAELRAKGYEVETDAAATVELASLGQPLGGQLSGIPGYPCYRTVEETYSALENLATAHPDLAETVDLGDSWVRTGNANLGYDLRGLVITNRNSTAPKAPFLLIAAIHAREYTTAELATRFAERLVNGYGVDPDITWILDHTEIHVVPQLNPDGRKMAEAGSSWRKNVDNSHCGNTSSRGVDLNRNSSFFWGPPYSGDTACDSTYRGPSAGSEPETQAIEAYMASIYPDQRGPALTDPAPETATGLFISLHSYSQLVLYSWEGGGNPAAPNVTALATLGRKFGFHNRHEVCNDCLYFANGTTVDVAYGVYGVAGYTFELGTSFFQSCSVAESSVFPSNMNALLYAAKAARRPYQEPRGPEVINVALGLISVESGSPMPVSAGADDTRSFSNGHGTEPSQAVAAVAYSIDEVPWEAAVLHPLAAADGAFDETVEAVTGAIDTTGLTPGRHRVYLVATDAAGHRGVPTAVFLDVTADVIFADSFESGGTGQWSLSAQ